MKNSELISLANQLSKYAVGGEGNVSARLTNELFVIKASGTSLSSLSEKDLVTCNNQAIKTDNTNNKPSIEAGFHAWFFATTNCKFVAHVHPTQTLKILCSEQHTNLFATKRLFPDQVVFNDLVSCIVPYKHPGLELCNEIKHCVNSYLEKHSHLPKLILLRNHGVITTGTTVKDCVTAIDICEKAAEIYLGAHGLGHISFISDADSVKVIDDQNEVYRKTLIQ